VKILVAEDTMKVAETIASALRASGFVCDVTGDGEDVLDLGLPSLDGLTILKRWRTEGITTPVLILSARGTWSERVEGIDSGADDYLPKPFEMQELLSRLRAIMRRQTGQASTHLAIGKLAIDTKASQVSIDGNPVKLTPLEFRMVHYLANNHGRVVAPAELADNLYSTNHDRDTNAIEAAISRLRRKLGNNVLQNKRGFGYFLEE
jgi:two-component system, OmpR family, response regulator